LEGQSPISRYDDHLHQYRAIESRVKVRSDVVIYSKEIPLISTKVDCDGVSDVNECDCGKGCGARRAMKRIEVHDGNRSGNTGRASRVGNKSNKKAATPSQ
jgi:hypothetical protein